MLAYRDAMSFRASHYFVSYISDSSSVACGFGCSRETGHWNFQVKINVFFKFTTIDAHRKRGGG
jgi:hypothetical protein